MAAAIAAAILSSAHLEDVKPPADHLD